jgi:hypothetical protein
MDFDAPNIPWRARAAPMPSAPPPRVLDAIGAAARTYDRLEANGVQLRFHLDAETGTVAVHVYDRQGTAIGSLAPSQLLDVATRGTFCQR